MRIVELGVGIANGGYLPGMEYYRAVTDGEDQAKQLKARMEAARQSSG